MADPHPVFSRLRAAATASPIVVAHRGDSRNHPENTLAAFRAATALGVAMQEFDVQQNRDGELFFLHDVSLDRTTDAARVLGPGALLAQTSTAAAPCRSASPGSA
jgi:glycerophosphoryl diester phosphodiesterase